jgi:glycosyltransferase involved in cell wall biosynthesis
MPEVGVVIAGDGPEDYARSLRQRAEMAGVADRIAWIGFVVRAEKSDMLAAADCFVLPSHSESFGMAAIEAVSAGLPCVLGNGVALAEDLAAAGVAVAVAPTAEGVARGVGDAMAMIEDDFSTRAQRFVAMNYSTDVIGATLAALYDRVAQTRISGRLA